MHLRGPILFRLALALALPGLGAGCVSLAVGGAAVGGVAAVEERSLGTQVDDRTLYFKVNERLLSHSDVLFRKANVEVNEGRVLLTGNVTKPEDRVAASDLAWQVVGVREVLNELQVTDRTELTDFPRDSWITTQLKTKLLTDTKVLQINYSVETINGIVYLIGIAQTQDELDRVTNHARNISGVQRVVSYVRLKDDPKRRVSSN
jgi:osmotically-inducible protein OsmY